MSATQSSTPAPSLSNPAILDAANITKQFGGLTAVSDVSFTLPEKSIVSIIGPNGAGKTTFFNMLTGFYRPTFGTITLGDRNITGARPYLVMKAGMARTFQNIRLFSTMSATENVMIGANSRMKSVSWSDSCGFMPAVGSSSSSTFGSEDSARAISTRRWSP